MSNTSDEYELRLVANDQASKAVDNLATKVEKLTDDKHEVEVDADTKAAEQEVKGLDKLLEGLSDDQKAIVLKAKADQAEAEIKRIDRGLAKVRDQGELEIRLQARDDATERLEDVDRLRKELDGTTVEMAVNVTGDSAARLDDTAAAADRAQAGIGTLRGVTDELGDSAAGIGIFGAAAVDAGETVQIFSKQLGLSQAQADRLSGAIGGIAIAATAAAAIGVTAWQAYNAKQEETRQKTESATAAMSEQLGVLDALKEAAGVGAESFGSFNEAFTAALTADMDDGNLQRTTLALSRLGLTIDDLGPTLRNIKRDSEATFSQLARDSGVPADLADAFAEAVNKTESWSDARLKLITDGWSESAIDQFGNVGSALEELNDQQQNYKPEDIAEKTLATIAATDDASRALVEQAAAQAAANGEGESAVAIYDQLVAIQTANGAAAGDAALKYAGMGLAVAAAAGAVAGAEEDVATMRTTTYDAATATDRLTTAYENLTKGVTEEKTWLQLQQQFDDVRAKAVEAFTAASEGSEDAEEKARSYRLAQLDLIQSTLAYALEVKQIPASKATEIQALIDQGKLDEAELALTEATNARDAEIVAQADTNEATQKLNTASASRDVNLTARADTSQAKADIDSLNGREVKVKLTAAMSAFASGTRGAPGGPSLVGEDGPEIVDLPRGSRVYTAEETRDILGAGAGGGTVTNNYFYPPEVGARSVGLAQREGRRRGFLT